MLMQTMRMMTMMLMMHGDEGDDDGDDDGDNDDDSNCYEPMHIPTAAVSSTLAS